MFRTQNVPVHPEDQKILEIAQGLCQRLEVRKLNPRTVSWVRRLGIRRVPVDFVVYFRDQLRLSSSLTGKLDPGQWEGLLATSLIYQTKMQGRIVVRMLTRTFLPFFTFLVGGITIIKLLLANQQGLFNTAIILVIASSMVVLMIGYIDLFRSLKRFWFDADFQASTLVGPEKLKAALQTLQSIQSIEGAHEPRFGRTKPSMVARLSKLQQPTP